MPRILMDLVICEEEMVNKHSGGYMDRGIGPNGGLRAESCSRSILFEIPTMQGLDLNPRIIVHLGKRGEKDKSLRLLEHCIEIIGLGR